MNLRPTNVPLTTKEFDREKVGVCFGCGCFCGYIAYLRGKELVDVYGHPNDPNGMGSLCSKGIALLQELPQNPMRVRKVLIKEGDSFREGSLEEVRKRVGKRVGIFLDRITSDLKDHLTALKVTDHVYGDAVRINFRPSTLKPQEWPDRKVILALECDPVFSEVMLSRWIVDAVERGSYLIFAGSRFGTVAQKSRESLIVKPPKVVKFLEEVALSLEGKRIGGLAGRVADLLRSVRSLILIGDLILRTPWRGNVLRALQRIRRRTRADYSVVGDVSPLPMKGPADLLRDLVRLNTLIMTGNPMVYMPEGFEDKLRDVFKIHITLFPNLTANMSDVIIPTLSFQERSFTGYRTGSGEVRSSGCVIRSEGYTLSELLRHFFGVEVYDITVPALPTIEDADLREEAVPAEEEGIYIVAYRTLVDEIGHWNLWTHEMEKFQEVLMNERTAVLLGVKETFTLNGVELRVRIDNNVADETVLIPDSFEETQPFEPGIRIGRLLPEPDLRVFRYR